MRRKASPSPSGVSPELERLRQLIRQDVQELIRSELGRAPGGDGGGGPALTSEFQQKAAQRTTRRSATSGSFTLPKVDQREAQVGVSRGAPGQDIGRTPFDSRRGYQYTPLLPVDPPEVDGMESADGIGPFPDRLNSKEGPGADDKAALNELKQASGLARLKDASKMYVVADGVEAHPLIESFRASHPDMSPQATYIVDSVEYVLLLKEPKREGLLADLCQSRTFEFFFSFIILLNAVFMVARINEDVIHPNKDPDAMSDMIDRAFLISYTVELLIKLVVHRLYFFWNADMGWNWLDFSLVFYSYFEIVICSFEAEGEKSTSKVWMRSVRLFRIAKVLRILRVVKAFEQLQLLMNCILGSFVSLFWSCILIFVSFYLFSLILVQQAGTFLAENSDSPEKERLLMYFGSVQQCIWTLFSIIFGADGWNMYFDPLSVVGPVATGTFFIFIVFSNIALLNILTGVFVERALKLALGDQQTQAAKHHERTMEDAQELLKLCTSWDNEKSKTMTKAEFEQMAESEDFSCFLHFIGLDITNITMFYNLISDSDDRVEVAQFVAGCMQLRGAAKTCDLLALMLEVERIKQGQEILYEDIRAELSNISTSVRRSVAHSA